MSPPVLGIGGALMDYALRMDFPRPEALVFDLDGLLHDTERIAREGFIAACRTVGVTPDLDVYLRAIGTTSRNTRRILTEGHGDGFPIDAVIEAWNERFREHEERGNPLPLKPGAAEILEAASRLRLPVALATSSTDPGVGERLERVGLIHHFAVRVTGDQVAKPKPDPEPFLKAAADLGVPPQRCWAYEDSPNGVRSAAAAGMYVFQIPDYIAPDEALLRLGIRVLPDLHAAQRQLEAAFGAE